MSVNWQTTGLQNPDWGFESLHPCHLNMPKKLLLLIVAHPSKNSLTYKNASILKQNAVNRGYKVKVYEAYKYPLVSTHPYKTGNYGSEFNDIANDLLKAKKIVIVAPMWNFSLPGGLKNFIDGSIQAKKHFKMRGYFMPPKGYLKAKEVVCVYTAGAPWFYFLFGFLIFNFKRQVKFMFGLAGVRKYRFYRLANVNGHTNKKTLNKWFKKLKKIPL